VAIEKAQCTANPTADEQHVLRLMQGTTVIKSQPLYSLVSAKDVQPSARVNGATLVVRPPAGVSPAEMTRTLQCHAAQAVLGQVDRPLRDDPFVLSGSWLDIEVTPQDGGFYAVAITARDIDQGLKVFQNANTFAENRGGWVDNTCVPWEQSTERQNGCPQRPSSR
jgi:hypothetical protein